MRRILSWPKPQLQVQAFIRWSTSWPQSILIMHWRPNQRQKQESSRVHYFTEPNSVIKISFISKHHCSFSSATFSLPLSYFLSPSSPLLHLQTENVSRANVIHSSPKGSWDLYCKDLIDWNQRQDSPSSLTRSLARALCVSFFSFTLTKHTKLNSAWGSNKQQQAMQAQQQQQNH